MNTFNRIAAVLGFALVSAQAQAVTFDFTAAGGPSYTDSLTGLTVTASAWAETYKTGNILTFGAATLTPATDGLGVCNSKEGGCLSTNDKGALGNKPANELILFTFSGTVNLQSLAMLQIGTDSDLSLWAGTGTFSPAGLKASLLGGTATTYSNTSNVNNIKSVSLAAYTGSYDWLAIAASATNKDKWGDLARLQSLTVNPVAQPVPEAATWMTMLAGLGLVGFRVSRRMQT